MRGIDPRTSHMQSERSTTELHPLMLPYYDPYFQFIFLSSHTRTTRINESLSNPYLFGMWLVLYMVLGIGFQKFLLSIDGQYWSICYPIFWIFWYLLFNIGQIKVLVPEYRYRYWVMEKNLFFGIGIGIGTGIFWYRESGTSLHIRSLIHLVIEIFNLKYHINEKSMRSYLCQMIL